MEKPVNKSITVKTDINEPVEIVWKLWTTPEHITHWNNAADDWHSNRLLSRMEAKDGSFGFGKPSSITLKNMSNQTKF